MKSQTLVLGILFVIWIVIIYFYIPKRNESFSNPSRIVVSLTTTPSRINKIEPTLKSLSQDQTLKPDIIYLNIPRIFKRTGESYVIPAFVQEYPTVMVNYVVEDLGPITKLVPALKKEKDSSTFIIIVDDDVVYYPEMISDLVKGANKYPNTAVTHTCDAVQNHAKINKPTPYCEIVEGIGGILFTRSMFGDDFFEYVNKFARTKTPCFNADDFVISNYLSKKNISKIDLYNLKKVLSTTYSSESDALHQIYNATSSDTKGRYKQCRLFIQRVGEDVYIPEP